MTTPVIHCGMCGAKGASQQKHETENDQRNFDQSVAEKEQVQNAARIIAKNLNEFR